MNKKARGVVLEKISDLPKRFRVFLFLLIFLFVFGTISFKIVEKKTFSESFMRTLEALAFMFSSKILAGKLLEIFLALFGVFCIWWILWNVADLFIEGKISEYLKTRLNISKIKRMEKHFIIVGGGRVGEEIAKNLYRIKKDFVIIERDPVKVEKLRKKSYLVVDGDITSNEVEIMEKANIKKAKSILLVLPETEKNLFLTLSAKELNPEIDIYSRADNPIFASRMKKAGAKIVIVPEIAIAEKFLQEFKLF